MPVIASLGCLVCQNYDNRPQCLDFQRSLSPRIVVNIMSQSRKHEKGSDTTGSIDNSLASGATGALHKIGANLLVFNPRHLIHKEPSTMEA